MNHFAAVDSLKAAGAREDTLLGELVRGVAQDSTVVTVENFPPSDSAWVRIGLPVPLAILAVLRALCAAHHGAIVGGREARTAGLEAQKRAQDSADERAKGATGYEFPAVSIMPAWGWVAKS